jgi:hypothetical protein
MTSEQFWAIFWRLVVVILLLANLAASLHIMNFVREI